MDSGNDGDYGLTLPDCQAELFRMAKESLQRISAADPV